MANKVFKRTTEIKPTKTTKTSVSGRPKDTQKHDAFKAVADYLENNDDE